MASTKSPSLSNKPYKILNNNLIFTVYAEFLNWGAWERYSQEEQYVAMNDKEGLSMQWKTIIPNLKKTISYFGCLGTLPISGAGREI